MDEQPASRLYEKKFTVRKAAERLGVSENSVRSYICRGLIKAYRFGGKVLTIYQSDLEQFIEQSVVDINADAE